MFCQLCCDLRTLKCWIKYVIVILFMQLLILINASLQKKFLYLILLYTFSLLFTIMTLETKKNLLILLQPIILLTN